MAAMVAIKVAIIQGTKMSVGLAAFEPARKAMMLTGINCKPDACRQRNIICALEALVLSGLISCKLAMAFNPKGVAALSSPNRLALKFIIMCPIAGWPFGTSGNILEKKGPMILDNRLMPPAFSAIPMNPINKAITPINPRERFTAVLQVSIMPSTGFCKRLVACLKVYTFATGNFCLSAFTVSAPASSVMIVLRSLGLKSLVKAKFSACVLKFCLLVSFILLISPMIT